jgi:hypothetical protein
MQKKLNYLSKSDFKVAQTCATKLYYKKNNYPNALNENEYMQMLADGGYLIGHIAQMMFPEGKDLSNCKSTKEAIEKTEELLKNEQVIIFEAAIQVDQYLIRIDILKRSGNTLHLIEVKSKSFSQIDAQTKKNYFSGADFKPYTEDLGFQHFVLQKKFPGAELRSYLMLPDKSETAQLDGILGWFDIISPEKDSESSFRQTQIIFKGTEQNKKDLIKEEWLKQVDLTYLIISLQTEIEKIASIYAKSVVENSKITVPINCKCRDCEFKGSGFNECWGALANAKPHILELGQLGNVNRRKNFKDGINELISAGKTSLYDIPVSAVEPEDDKEEYYNNRPLYQLTVKKEFLLNGINEIVNTIEYPLHFIDFETSNMAVPLHKDMHPYENVIFQWSVHTLHKDNRLEHFEWINTEDDFPNYECMKALHDIIGNKGTVFTWSKYENTQMRKSQETFEIRGIEDANLTQFFNEIILDKDAENSRQVDMNALALKFYFHPKMGGRTSIKVTLPAILSENTSIAKNLLKQNNFYQEDENGNIVDPYLTLPKITINNQLLDEDSLELLSKTLKISNGGVAMTAYRDMMFGFGKNNPEAKQTIKNALLRYCELDTLAMVIIWEHWRGLQKK